MRRQVYTRCMHPRRHRYGLASTTPCGALLWPSQVEEHLKEEHGVESGPLETVEDEGRNCNNPFTCDCGEPAVHFSRRDRKCDECRRSESNSRPPLREGYCIKCRLVQPADECDTCGACRERANIRPSLMGRPSRARRAG